LLLSASAQVRYVPDGLNGETASFGFVAWDQSSGVAATNGLPTYANALPGGGTSAFSAQSGVATMVVTSVNDAPTLTNGATVTLAGTDEDTTSPVTTVASVLTAAGWADVDTGANRGIAVILTTGNGTWQYSTDGLTWTAFGSVSGANALLLTSASQVRYVPDGLNGETATFGYKAWDLTSGVASVNAGPAYANAGTGGGISAFSSQSASASLLITSVNDAPTITNGATVVLTGTDEDTVSPTTTVSTILASAGGADVDIGALRGIAVNAKAGNGTWQYSTNGVAWTGFGSVGGANALLLDSSTQIRYVPDTLNGEVATFGFVAWDQTSGVASGDGTPQYASPAPAGGRSTFSAQSATASITILPVNDAPTISGSAPIPLPATSGTKISSATSVAVLLGSASWADVDSGALKGIAVTTVSGSGVWQYSVDGLSWVGFGSVGASNALLLGSAAQVRYIPGNPSGELAGFSFRAWDQSAGTASTVAAARYGNPGVGGGVTAFSAASSGVSIVVAPAGIPTDPGTGPIVPPGTPAPPAPTAPTQFLDGLPPERPSLILIPFAGGSGGIQNAFAQVALNEAFGPRILSATFFTLTDTQIRQSVIRVAAIINPWEIVDLNYECDPVLCAPDAILQDLARRGIGMQLGAPGGDRQEDGRPLFSFENGVKFTAALSAAAVGAWVLRGAGLLTSVMMSMRAWRYLDPIPVLAPSEAEPDWKRNTDSGEAGEDDALSELPQRVPF
jgi:hypothetical protein